jgi:N-acyl-L-homoserine lactone synthetase
MTLVDDVYALATLVRNAAVIEATRFAADINRSELPNGNPARVTIDAFVRATDLHTELKAGVKMPTSEIEYALLRVRRLIAQAIREQSKGRASDHHRIVLRYWNELIQRHGNLFVNLDLE